MKKGMKWVVLTSLVFALVLGVLGCTSQTGWKDGTYQGKGSGRNGDIEVQVTVSKGKITSIEVLSQEETPNLGDVAIEEVIDSIIKEQKLDVDGVSGATISSDGLKEAVENALK